MRTYTSKTHDLPFILLSNLALIQNIQSLSTLDYILYRIFNSVLFSSVLILFYSIRLHYIIFILGT